MLYRPVPFRCEKRIGRVLVFAALAVSANTRAQEAPMGVVQQAIHARVKQGDVSEGATVYPGEELSTDVGGVLALSASGVGLRLLESSSAFLYHSGTGPLTDLRNGTMTFRKEAGSSNITIVASDVRIVSKGDGAATGHVLILSPCEVRVTTVVGQVEVTAGNEKQTMGERETYS